MTTAQPLLTTGVSGLVGSHFARHYQGKYQIDNLDISDPVRPIDITDRESVFRVFEQSSAESVIHLAAFTDVTKAWEQRDDTTGLAYRVNVLGTQVIADACQAFGKHLILVSTAYVFDGEKNGLYVEGDQVNPIEWYGQTKALAEEVVTAAPMPWTILRIDQPFVSDETPRPDVVRRIAQGLQSAALPPQFVDHTFGPTFVDDFSRILDWVVETKTTGLYHATSGEQWTDFAFATALQKTLKLENEVQPGKLESYLQKLNRPYQRNTALSSEKLQQLLPFSLTPISEALAKVIL
jgi:dTDP-4-dehydrorhamnose reductase